MKDVLGLIFGLLVVLLIYLLPTDSTDTSSFNRSGMSVYVDQQTGCEYLGKIFGPVTPRLDKNGKQICK